MPPLPSSSLINVEDVRRAFSAQAPLFDSYEKRNVIIQWMRSQVYRHVEAFLSPGDSIFELNAGTGIDAAYFAQHGHPVFAVDNADGMLVELEKKVRLLHLEGKVRFANCSFTELASLQAGAFNHVFSNFGGLNCVDDLRPVTSQLPRFLAPGGTVTFVIMPHICPWELLHAFTGNTALAFRRLSKKGAPASVEGHKFRTYYFSPRDVIRSFDDRFILVKLRGLAAISLPPSMSEFADRHPKFYNTLKKLDEQFSILPPLSSWADHFIITMRYLG